MLTFVPYFATPTHANWLQTGDDVYYKSLKDYPNTPAKTDSIMMQWEKDNPEPIVTIADMADHFDYAKKLIGVDHIGMAGDFDGIHYTIKGLGDVSTYPGLLKELAQRGWTLQELKKISGENFLRVFEEVEHKAAALKQVKTK
jgi:membrane dipeptidase